ncbi:hypothetical protein N7467_010988 [Penicillium canescens]|nr:hypothetical protein N7467_010988 [Penicillium canescens]
MATAGKKKEFLCIMPDRPNVLELRKKVKAGHYEGIQPLIAGGKLVDGGQFNEIYGIVHELTHWLGRYTGAIFAEHPQEGKDAQFLGSVVVYTGGNAAEVREIINNDIYAKSGVWDLEKVQIYPCCAEIVVAAFHVDICPVLQENRDIPHMTKLCSANERK